MQKVKMVIEIMLKKVCFVMDDSAGGVKFVLIFVSGMISREQDYR